MKQVDDRQLPRRGRGLRLLAAVTSFAVFVWSWFSGNEQDGIFVGLWVPSILALGAAPYAAECEMNHLGIFLVGIGVTLIVASALALLVWGAILDGREEAGQRELRGNRGNVVPTSGLVPEHAAQQKGSTQ